MEQEVIRKLIIDNLLSEEEIKPEVVRQFLFDIAYTALRQAIEQAEKQPDLKNMTLGCPAYLYDSKLKAEKQEPVAWYERSATPGVWFLAYSKNPNPNVETRPLVFGDTAPPQREWVGLTDEDIGEAFEQMPEYDMYDQFARALEDKLKEKNT